MLATENSLRKMTMVSGVAAILIFSGCTPPGPRALLDGDELLRAGRVARAIPKLEQATKLLPGEPRAWNLLGVAYHRAGQPQMAVQAYRQALAKDHSNAVAVAHYNLGCLLLEQNNLSAAVDELRSFTLSTNSAVGLVKLATAQLRLRQFDAAERNFISALKSEPKNTEALNGIGVIHGQRQQRDAAQFFSSALEKNPKYAPALLNSAILAQQNPATKQAALQRCRDFLAAAPQSPQADAVKSLVRQLETELAPPRLASAPVPTNATANAALKTNALLAALQATNPPATSTPSRIMVSTTNAKPSVVVLKTNVPAVPTNQLAVNLPVAATNTRAAATELPRIETNLLAPAANLPVTVVTLTNQTLQVIAPPEPITITPESNRPIEPVEPVGLARSEVGLTTPEFDRSRVRSEVEKEPGFFSRLNPFRAKAKPPPASETRVLVRAPSLRGSSGASNAPQPTFARYMYLSPAPPREGNRRDAERAMAQGGKAQRAGNTNEALLDYQLAVSADPSYFDGQYNLALLAYQAGDLKRSLAVWETALALQPESINARYNFALALKQEGFAQDAVIELKRVLEAKPNEARAHLTLGNLYAQQFNEAEKARAHYAQVLELDPRNPQAAAIRFWLAANP